jgi:acyl-CoA synthetase (AMP-forming)/AMP-acid ligase II
MMFTLRDVLFNNPHIKAESPAVTFGATTLTYGQLQDAVTRVARQLRSEGVQGGDRVSVLLENVPEYLISYFAITSIGAIYVPLNWRLHASEHVVLMNNAEPKVLIASSAFAESVSAARSGVPSLATIVTLGEALEGCEEFYAWSKDAESLPDDFIPSAEDGAVIVYTSGTTGLPKGALLTHGNVVFDLHNIAGYGKQTPSSTIVHVAPLYHQTCVHVLVHLMFGAHVVLLRKFDVADLLSTVQRFKGTYMFLAPTMLYEILDYPELSKFDLSSLQTIVYGAAPITGARLRKAIEVFGMKLVQGYGLTEATSHVAYLDKQEHLVAEGSIGRGIPGVESRVVNDDGKDVKPKEIGEIIVRGRTVMKEYWREPKATQETVVDGWLHSGDLAEVDERGFMYIVGRKKDLVISGGVNIYPRDIEEVLSEHKGIAEAAAFGVPDPYWGEALTAAVVPREGFALDPAEVQAFCREHLGGYQVPKRVEVVSTLPKNASGKILKRELRRIYGTETQATESSAPAN